MAFRPNYRLQRADRARAQAAKRDEKLRQRQERSAERKAAAAAAGDPVPDAAAADPATPAREPGRKD
jgi:hypothetical protein